MDITTFHASRRYADVRSGRIAFFEKGEGPAALFVHGVPLNGYHWRNIIERVQHRRRCIAIDLMALGYTEISPVQDVTFTAQAQMLAEVVDALGIEKIDLVANDSGGAIAQIFAAHHPERLTSLVLTNCDVHDGWPPPQVLPIMEHARKGTLAPIFQSMLDRPDLARERYARGEIGAAVSQLRRSDHFDGRGHPALSAAAAVLAAAHRRLPTILAGLRQYAHPRHTFGAQGAAHPNPYRVGLEGHLFRQDVGLLAQGHDTGREASHRNCGRSAVLSRGSSRYFGWSYASVLG